MSFTAAESIQYIATLISLPDAAGQKQAILAIASGAGLPTTAWVPGDPDERTAEYMGRAMNAWGAIPIAAVRALFFPLSTDPGDVDDFGNADISPDQTPRPGFLSAVGQGFYGTTRGGQTNATSLVTIRNAGSTATAPFSPGDLTFEQSTAVRDDGGKPTYVSTPDPSVYTGIGGTLTLAAGATTTLPLPVQAVQPGSYGNAPANAIDVVVTQSFGNLVVVSSTAASGQEREDRSLYIGRCLIAPASNAPGGPQQAYLRAMNTARDGTTLQRHDGTGPVSITRAQVTRASSTGLVDAYFATSSGAADATDRASADANILGFPLGIITDPIGVVPDTATYTGHSASETNTAITYSVRAKASSIPGSSPGTYTTGGSPPAVIAAVFNAIGSSIDALFGLSPVGGVEQDGSGNGVLYTSEIVDAIHDARAGLYGAALTIPGTSTIALNLGFVPTRGTTNGTLVVVA